MPTIEFKVLVELEKTAGKFVSVSDLEEELIEVLDEANPNTITLDESEYEVATWDIQQVVRGK